MTNETYLVDQYMVTLVVAMFAIAILVMLAIGLLWWIGRNRLTKIEERIARQIEEWAEADLELKRTALASSITVPDTLAWFSRIATRATGATVSLTRLAEPATPEPRFLMAEDMRGMRYLLSATTPQGLHRYRPPSRWPWASRLERYGVKHPLIPLPRGAEKQELSTLNCGITFDLEAAQVWERSLKEKLQMSELWLYILPPVVNRGA